MRANIYIYIFEDNRMMLLSQPPDVICGWALIKLWNILIITVKLQHIFKYSISRNYSLLLNFSFVLYFQSSNFVIQFQISSLTKKMNKSLCFVLIFYLKISQGLIKDEIHDDFSGYSFVLPGKDNFNTWNINKFIFSLVRTTNRRNASNSKSEIIC